MLLTWEVVLLCVFISDLTPPLHVAGMEVMVGSDKVIAAFELAPLQK